MRLLSPWPVLARIETKNKMTISQRLNEVRSGGRDRTEIAVRLAASLSDAELLELMLSPVLADRALGASLAHVGDCRAELRLGRSGCTAAVRLEGPGPQSLVTLSDRKVSLVTEDEGLRRLWGPALTFRTPDLLEALQFARDEADGLLYRPSSERLPAMRRRAHRWRMKEDLLLSLSVQRGALQTSAATEA